GARAVSKCEGCGGGRMQHAGPAVAWELARIAAHHVPDALNLLAHVKMKILSEAQNKTEDVVSDDVAEDAAHVRHGNVGFDELGKQILLHARGRRLVPAQIFVDT